MISRPALLALAATLVVAAGEGRGDELRSTGKGLAEGGPVWIGPRPTAPARRVVALAPSVTDVVVALGLGDRLVGVTRLDDNREVANLPRIGGYLDPNPEAVVGLLPDLVVWVTNGSAAGAVRKIAELSRTSRRPFPILALQIDGIADVLASPRVIADALGEPARGETLARELADGVEAVRRRAAGRAPKRVLFVVGREPLIVAGQRSFAEELLRVCGARNVVQGEVPWPIYPLEKAVADDPDVVVDAAPQEAAEGIRRLAAIPAVRRGAVVRLADDDLIRPGPRMVRGLDALCRGIHREGGR